MAGKECQELLSKKKFIERNIKTFEDDTENIDVIQDTIITLKTTLNSINKKLAEKIAQDHRKRNLNRRFDSISDQMSTWMGR